MPSKEVSPIKDIVHGYIPISPLEKIVIDSRQFQRLHFVLQNSSTYTAYPTNKNSRFSHSLGVAHVAGKMFESALRNASDESLVEALNAMAKFIDSFNATPQYSKDDLTAQWKRSVGYQIPFQMKIEDSAKDIVDQDAPYQYWGPLFLINTFGAALRVCGLVHDIGHLPMSHIFESALEEVELLFDRYQDSAKVVSDYKKSAHLLEAEILTPGRRTKDAQILNLCRAIGVEQVHLDNLTHDLPVHEKLSLQIFDRIAEDVASSSDQDKHYVKLVFHVAQAILLSNKDMQDKYGATGMNPLLLGLREIISGELDADRIDYTLRDPIESGVTDRRFDLERLLSEITLHFSTDFKRFRICIGYKALSAVETVFHNRFLNYRFIIYHHSVVRMNCVLEEVIRQLIRICFVDASSKVADILQVHGLVKIPDPYDPGKNVLFPDFHKRIIDEAWLRSMLIAVTMEIERLGIDRYGYLVDLINTFLFRQTDNLKTMWKSEIDCVRISKELAAVMPGNPSIISAAETVVVEEVVVARARQHLNEMFVFLMDLNPKVYKAGDNGIRIVDGSGNLWEASDVSPYLRSLKDIANQMANFHVSFMGVGLKKNPDMLRICADIENEIVQAIAQKRNAVAAAA